jgi:hypothetical protein
MKLLRFAPAVAGALLGLLFIASGLVVLLKLVPLPPPPPKGTPPALFLEAFVPTGYLTFVKVLEVLGGLLVAIPRARNLGLLILGPIIVNILAYHIFIMGGVGLLEPPILIVTGLALYLLWAGRREFAGLLREPANAHPSPPA